MLDSIYVGLSGLTSFSTGLRNISNNVANINTTGYKGSSLEFSDLFYRYEPSAGGEGGANQYALGSGVQVGHALTVFKQGEIRQTGNDTDLAIDGNGFFILRQGGETFYSRNGQLSFDSNGVLVDQASGAHVAGLVGSGSLADIDIGDKRISPPQATSTVKLTGNLSVNDSDNTHTLSSVDVFDASGAKRTLSIVLNKNTDPTQRSWTIQVNEGATTVATGGEVRFNADGSPTAGFNTYTFSLSQPGGGSRQLTLDFGSPNSFTGVTSFSAGADSTAAVASQDGRTLGALTKTTFGADGTLTLQYSNGQTQKDGQIALAWFDDLQSLQRAGNGMFANVTDQRPLIGGAGTSLFGNLRSGSIEASNVDLAQQFSELIIIQRGYQSSSQTIGAANEMTQQLLDLVRRR